MCVGGGDSALDGAPPSGKHKTAELEMLLLFNSCLDDVIGARSLVAATVRAARSAVARAVYSSVLSRAVLEVCPP